MKQEPTTTRTRITRTTTNSPRTPEPTNGSSPIPKPRLKPAQNDPETTHNRIRRPLVVNRVKPSGDQEVGVRKEGSGLPGSRTVEQFSRPRRKAETNSKLPEKSAEGKESQELKRKLEESQCQSAVLKTQVEKLEKLNDELVCHNQQLVEKLENAEARIKELQAVDQTSEFGNVRKIIANKLDYFNTKKEIVSEESNVKPPVLVIQPKVSVAAKPPPPPPVRGAGAPPPPPPPPRASVKAVKSPSALVELYHSLTKREGMKEPLVSGNRGNKAHNSIVGELQNRSSHLLAIKSDVENKRDFIEYLIEKVQSAAYVDVEDVLTFVDCLDQELSTLSDERAVLKHFNWPERKADALREAAIEYRDLKRLEYEASSFEDDSSLPCETGLKKIESLLDKMERSIQRLIKLRSSSMLSYKECKIPIDWMLDSGMVKKVKLASMKLAKVYITRLSTEHELLRHSERDSVLCQGVRFAYRAHQFSGGLDPETMHRFEELRGLIQAH